ncbi:MAG: redoxin domain-containing protein [Bacteroidetes bacterium]|nr:redoxin domain-containing protein [Bacteroidota bacterium]
MNKIFTITFFLFVVLSNSFSQTKIKGEILGENKRIYLSTESSLIPLTIENHKFSLEVEKGKSPISISFALISKKGKISYLTPKIWMDSDSVNIKLDFSNEQVKYEIDNRYIFQNLSEKIEKSDKKDQIKLIRNNLDKYPALFFLYKKMEDVNIKVLSSLYTLILERNKLCFYAQRIKGYIDAKKLKTPKKGKQFESFRLEDKNGKIINIYNQSEKYKLLAFMSSACYYSLSSLSELSELYEKYNTEIEFITIWNDKKKNTWQNYKAKLKSVVVWTDLWDKTNFAHTYFDITISPSFILVNKEGVIIKIIRGFDCEKLKRTVIKNIK